MKEFDSNNSKINLEIIFFQNQATILMYLFLLPYEFCIYFTFFVVKVVYRSCGSWGVEFQIQFSELLSPITFSYNIRVGSVHMDNPFSSNSLIGFLGHDWKLGVYIRICCFYSFALGTMYLDKSIQSLEKTAKYLKDIQTFFTVIA